MKRSVFQAFFTQAVGEEVEAEDKAHQGEGGHDGSGAAGEHFMDVSLVGNVEHELVGGCGENTVEGDAEFDDTEVWAEVAAGDGEAVDQGFPDLSGEGDEIRFREVVEVSGSLDRAQ